MARVGSKLYVVHDWMDWLLASFCERREVSLLYLLAYERLCARNFMCAFNSARSANKNRSGTDGSGRSLWIKTWTDEGLSLI